MKFKKQNTYWKFFGSYVKFETYVKKIQGDLDYDFEIVDTSYPAVNSEYICDQKFLYDFDTLKKNEIKHSKDGSVTFVIFVRFIVIII